MTGIWIAAIVVALVIGWFLGTRRTPPDLYAGPLEAFSRNLESGEVGAPSAGEPESLTRARRAVAKDWQPKDADREAALSQALGRIAAFLEESVEAPLSKARDGDRELLREGVDRALGGLKDLEFFLREPITPDETHNLTPLVQQATREFIEDWEIGVRFMSQQFPVRAHVHRETFLDAVYLLLHNAGQFGDSKTVDVKVHEEEGRAVIDILDRGPGFSAEALEHARDLFYTTKSSSLGLGIPFARRIIEGFGGNLELSNRPDGGAAVRLTLPKG